MKKAWLVTSLIAAFMALLALDALGDVVSAVRDASSVFVVSKSENRNQVHYGVRVDAACVPVGPSPAFAYWRMLERGPRVVEPLLALEKPAYGFAENRLTEGGGVRVRLAALPGRPIVIDIARGPNGCVATASTTIDGAAASLTGVYVKLRWLFGVDHLVVWGRTADGRIVRETVKP